MSTLPLSHPHLESPPPPHRHSTDSGDTASSRSSADVRSWHSPTDSTGDGGSSIFGTEIVGVSNKRRESSVSECSVEVDLEAGVHEGQSHLSKLERDCRIFHLSLDLTIQESGIPIELGCSCKGDLAAAHKQCAETWFKIKGNRTCEICGSTASNVAGANDGELMDQWNEANDTAPSTSAAAPAGWDHFRNSKLLAGAPFPKLFVSLYGLCLCHLLAISLQCSLVSVPKTSYCGWNERIRRWRGARPRPI